MAEKSVKERRAVKTSRLPPIFRLFEKRFHPLRAIIPRAHSAVTEQPDIGDESLKRLFQLSKGSPAERGGAEAKFVTR